MRRRTGVALVLALLLGGVVLAEMQPGEERRVQSRDGAALRETPSPVGKRLSVLAPGTAVVVESTQGLFARVRTEAGVVGWVRASDLVQRGALTGRGAAAGGGTSADVSLAGRQFDETTEGELKATEADLARAYPLVDALEGKRVKPGSDELDAFIAEGRLGRDR